MQQLYEAFRAGDRERANALVAADLTLAIFAAALFGDTPEIEKLLAANRSLVTAVSPGGWFPLHLAAHFGHAEAARLLLNKGAQVNACSTNASRNMALHAADVRQVAGCDHQHPEQAGRRARASTTARGSRDHRASR